MFGLYLFTILPCVLLKSISECSILLFPTVGLKMIFFAFFLEPAPLFFLKSFLLLFGPFFGMRDDPLTGILDLFGCCLTNAVGDISNVTLSSSIGVPPDSCGSSTAGFDSHNKSAVLFLLLFVLASRLFHNLLISQNNTYGNREMMTMV